MNLVKIICPKCGAEKKLSLVDTSYVGPQRCWKCHELFTITIHNNQVRSSEPLSEEEFQKQVEAKAAREGIANFKFTPSGQDDDIPRLSPERRRNYNQPFNQLSNRPPGEPPVQAEPERPLPEITPEGQGNYTEPSRQEEPNGPAPVNPPERFRTFVPLEDTPEEPEKPEKPKNPPDRFRFFIPPAT